MKIAVLVSLARQVEGEMVYAKVLKAHADANILKEFLNNTELPRTETINGGNFLVEYGVFKDIEVEGIIAEPIPQ